MSLPGKSTREHCPECGEIIVYNGNYFCKSWGMNKDDCKWALPHPQKRLIDQQISWRLNGYWEMTETKLIKTDPSWEPES